MKRIRVKRRLPAAAPVALLILLSLSHSSCRKSGLNTGLDSSRTIVLPASGADWVAAENQFSLDLFHAVLADDTVTHNLMISPFSVYMALSMVDNGAAGATRDSIDGALRMGDLSLDELNTNAKALITQLPVADPRVVMTVANSIWYDKSIDPLPGFLSATQDDYSAKVAALNFADPASVTTINQWVAGQTQQMIKSILDQINAGESMFLINAIYFKGAWTYQFDAGATQNAPFTLANGSQESAPMMTISKETPFPCFVNDSLTMVNIPYGGADYSMYALMPGANANIHTLAAALSTSSLAYWKSRMGTSSIQLYFPKFNFSYSASNLASELSAMGMGLAFQDNANFSDMFNVPAQISRVIHKTAIQVDETGTKAAAATAVGIVTSVATNVQPVHFDHPFVFVIQEKTSGVILFIGILNDPNIQG